MGGGASHKGVGHKKGRTRKKNTKKREKKHEGGGGGCRGTHKNSDHWEGEGRPTMQ